ncbi:MAG: MAPEG family protein [Pseudomonadota bacterium]
MPVEIHVLALAALLQIAQFAIMGVPVNLQVGVKYTGGPRDNPVQITGVAGRLFRAYNNHFEALILFTIAVVVVTLGGKSSALTENCAWTYLIARAVYVPAYASGIPMLRSLIWAVSFTATVIMLVAAVV